MRDLIGSPFYSSFHSLLTSSFSLVVSFNGATILILGYEFCSQGCHEVLVISICLRPCSCSHSSLTRPHASRLSRSPLVLTSAITRRWLCSGYLWLPIPSSVIAQHGPTPHQQLSAYRHDRDLLTRLLAPTQSLIGLPHPGIVS